MAVSYINGATTTPVSGTSISADVPSGGASGDLMIAILGHSDNNPVADINSVPSGWTQWVGKTLMGTAATSPPQFYIYYKVHSGSEPASYSWGWSLTGGLTAHTLIFRGQDGGTAWQGNTANSSQTGTGTDAISPSVSVTADGSQVIRIGWTDAGVGQVPPTGVPAGVSNALESETTAGGNGMSLMTGTEASDTATAPSRTWTLSGADERSGFSAVILPLSGPTITDVGDEDFDDEETGITITGSGFGASDTGSADVELGDSATYGSANLISLSRSGWSATSITGVVMDLGTQSPGGKWLYVTDSTGQVSAGYPVTVHRVQGWVMSASASITASGENTTARLTPPSGKTTGDFVAGRIQDDENPADSVDITNLDYTEMAWSIEAQTGARDVAYSFRVTANGTPLDTYTVTPSTTVQSGSTFNDSVGETLSASESQSASAVFVASAAESGSASESQNSTAVMGATVAESGSASEAQDVAFTTSASVAEAGTAAESQEVSATFEQSVADGNVGALLDSYDVSNVTGTVALGTTFSGITAAGQAFTAGATAKLGAVAFWVWEGSSTLFVKGTPVAKLYAATGTVGTDAVPTGAPLATSAGVYTRNVPPFVSGFPAIAPLLFKFDGSFELQNGTDYVVVIEAVDMDYASVAYDGSTPSHAGNLVFDSSGWSSVSAFDMCFELYAYSEADDVESAVAAFTASSVESSAAVEAQSAVATMGASVAEAGTAAEVASAVFTATASVAETGAAADDSDSSVSLNDSVDETGAAAESQTASTDYTATITEAGSAVEAQSVTASVTVSVAEGPGFGDIYPTSNGNTTLFGAPAGQMGGQTFRAVRDGAVVKAVFSLCQLSVTSGDVRAELYAATTGTYGTDLRPTGTPGTPLAVSDPIDASTLPAFNSFTDVEFAFDGSYTLVAGQYYSIVAHNVDANGQVHIECDSTSPTHGGNFVQYGASWFGAGNADVVFEVHVGTPITEDQSAAWTTSAAVSESGAASDTQDGEVTADINVSIAESGAASETQTVTAVHLVSVSEAGSATESQDATAGFLVTLAETGAASETQSAQADFVASIAESGTAADSHDAVITTGFDVTVAEAGAASESQSATAQLGVSVAEAASASEAQSAAVAAVASIAEAGSASESQTAITGIFGTVAELAVAADLQSATAIFVASAAESITATDVQSASYVATGSVIEAGAVLDAQDANVPSIIPATIAEAAFASDSQDAILVPAAGAFVYLRGGPDAEDERDDEDDDGKHAIMPRPPYREPRPEPAQAKAPAKPVATKAPPAQTPHRQRPEQPPVEREQLEQLRQDLGESAARTTEAALAAADAARKEREAKLADEEAMAIAVAVAADMVYHDEI